MELMMGALAVVNEQPYLDKGVCPRLRFFFKDSYP